MNRPEHERIPHGAEVAEEFDFDFDFDGQEGVVDFGAEFPSDDNLALGKRGEDTAARYLRHCRHYEILERNWSCPFGEADIIAKDGCTLVFVEVKTRRSIHKGFPEEAVTSKKRARYEKIAAWFIRDYDEVDIPVRFDVVALMVVSDDRAFLRHYVNAFGVGPF